MVRTKNSNKFIEIISGWSNLRFFDRKWVNLEIFKLEKIRPRLIYKWDNISMIDENISLSMRGVNNCFYNSH